MAAERPNVFISYRRDDAAANAGRLFDWLSDQFGDAHVFLDTSRIAIGADFERVLGERLAAADVVLVVIGPRWLDIADANGRRLDQPDDYVRMEVATALRSGTRLIPVLVGGARMPAAERLPDALRALATRNATELRDAGFEQDFDQLVNAILDRPRGYLKTELDRVQRLLRAIRVSTLLVPTVALLVVIAIWVGALEAFTLDTRAASYLMWAGEQLAPPGAQPGVLLVAVDGDSERRLQRDFGPVAAWRSDHARLLRRAAAAGATAVVFDLVFERATAADAELAAAMRAARARGTRVVVGVRDLDAGRPRIAAALRDAADWGSVCINRRLGYSYMAPLAVVAAGPDFAAVQPARTPALALAAVRGDALQAVDIERRRLVLANDPAPAAAPRFSLLHRISGATGDCGALADGDLIAAQLIRFTDAGYWHEPQRRVSYADALDPQRVPDSALAGRIVLVGATLGRRDRVDVVSGFDRHALYGVELHANAIANLLSGREMVTPTLDSDAWTALLAAAAGALFGYLAAAWNPWLRRALLLALAGGYLGVAAVFAGHGLLLNVLYHVSGFVIAFTLLRRLRSGAFDHRTRRRS